MGELTQVFDITENRDLQVCASRRLEGGVNLDGKKREKADSGAPTSLASGPPQRFSTPRISLRSPGRSLSRNGPRRLSFFHGDASKSRLIEKDV